MSELLQAIETTAQEARDGYGLNPDDAGPLPSVSQKPYKWIVIAGGLVRPECREHRLVMKWALKISKDYPPTVNKHTTAYHAHPVIFMGMLLQVYKCPHAGCEVEAVK